MIVRPADGEYVLISQVDHARIAVEIARSWRLPSKLDDLREEFLFAVEHHDDGWRDWERAPTIVDGAPRNFMDMPMPVATGIWSESVDVAAANSPWGGLWVSRHFCHLAELAIAHRTDPADRASAERFLAEATAGGYSVARLDTGPLQHEAHRLYARLGFTRIAPYYDVDAEMAGFLLFMERRLLVRKAVWRDPLQPQARSARPA